MNHYIRLFFTLLFAKLKTKVDVFETTEKRFRVMPWDLDLLGHMNNGTYLQVADVARVGWMNQTGILRLIVKNKWGAILGGNIIHYRKSLTLFEKYKVRTKLLGWHDKWVFLEHRFVDHRDRLVCSCLSRAALRDRKAKKWVSIQELSLDILGRHQLPELPEKVVRWLEADDHIVQRDNFNKVY